MAITTKVTDSYKTQIMDGIHLAADVYMIALYASTATLDQTITVYSSTDEIAFTGYIAGGMALSGRTTGMSGDTAYVSWTNPVWGPTVSFTARGALIYNATRGNKAVATYDFGSDIVSTGGNFTVELPAAGATSVVTIS